MTGAGKMALGTWRAAVAAPAFPAWAGPAERLRHLLEHAIRAPSRYNCQPWLFEIDGNDLAVHVDGRRALRAADPHGREAVIACGAAIENLAVAAGHHGHAVEVEAIPAGSGGLVARVRLAGRRPPAADGEALVRAIAQRRSSPAVRPVSIPTELAASLAREAEGEGAALRLVRPRQLRAVAELLADADADQWGNARFRAEHAVWTRGAGRLAPGAAPPRRIPGVLRRLLGRFRGDSAELERRVAAMASGLFLLSTRGDEPGDWLRAGRALQRVLLRATVEGLDASYLSAAVEVPWARASLRRALFEPGRPQVLLQLGHGPRLRPPRRRPLALVLRAFAIDVPLEPAGAEAEVA